MPPAGPPDLPEPPPAHTLSRQDLEKLGSVLACFKVGIDPAAFSFLHNHPGEQQDSAAIRTFTLAGLPDTQDPARDLKTILGDATFISRRWLSNLPPPPPAGEPAPGPVLDAAVFALYEDQPHGNEPDLAQPIPRSTRPRRIGLAVGGNGAYAHLDPYAAGKIAVAEAARNLACVGAPPLCTIATLKVGDGLLAPTSWQWQEFARALSEGCLAFNSPVTGDTVRFPDCDPAPPHNFSAAFAMAGFLPQTERIPAPGFKDPGDAILLLGDLAEAEDPWLGLGGSAYLRLAHHVTAGAPPRCDFGKERELHLALRALICSGVVKSAHDCAEGGLALTLLECCLARPSALAAAQTIGARIDLTPLTSPPAPAPPPPASPSTNPPAPRLDAWLFGEAQARVIISVAPLDAAKVLAQAAILGLPAAYIGTVGGDGFQVKTAAGDLNCPIAELSAFGWNVSRA
jgi:phosphoribosylformylglycinamidine synthase subunit PurL